MSDASSKARGASARFIRFGYRAAHALLRASWFVRRPKTRGALVAVWRRGEILLVKTSYRDRFGLPGGYVRRGESARDAASRELLEELSIEVAPEALVHAYGGTHRFEYRDDHVDIFELHVDEPPPVRVDGHEVVWAGFHSAREALSLALVPHLIDYLKDR